MPRGTKIMRSFADWPAEDQERWDQAFKPADRFEETSLGAHLAPSDAKRHGEKVMGVSWDSSRPSIPVASHVRQTPALTERHWPNTWPGGADHRKNRR